MDLISILPWAVFAAFACGAWAIINYLANKNSRTDERLEELRNPLVRGKDKDKADDPRAQSGWDDDGERGPDPLQGAAAQERARTEQAQSLAGQTPASIPRMPPNGSWRSSSPASSAG